jgi:hypothetical protein
MDAGSAGDEWSSQLQLREKHRLVTTGPTPGTPSALHCHARLGAERSTADR